MSGKLAMQVWHADYGDASTILVLMALADEANDAGECSVDLPTVAKKARQSERNCRYLLRKLEDLQIIERFEARGRKHHNRYQIHMGNLKNLQPVQVLAEDNLQPVQVYAHEQHANTGNHQKPATSAGYGKPANLQPVQVLKPANPATSAGFSSPLPPDPQPLENPKTLKPEDSPPLSPQGEARGHKHTKASKQPGTDYTPGFRLAWNAYPAVRHERKVATFAIWQARSLEPRAPEIAAKLERLTITLWAGREKRFIPLPTTWFNDARYEDDLVPLEVAHAASNGSLDTRLSRAGQQTMLAQQEMLARRRARAGYGPELPGLPEGHGPHE